MWTKKVYLLRAVFTLRGVLKCNFTIYVQKVMLHCTSDMACILLYLEYAGDHGEYQGHNTEKMKNGAGVCVWGGQSLTSAWPFLTFCC